MNATLFRGSWKIATIMGIPIRLHFSWLIIFGLITWSLSTEYFPKAAPDLPIASYWIRGFIAAVLFFSSICFHELAHSYVALKYNLSIAGITLFIFGGVAQMKGEPPHPKAEFRIAIAGPISSLLLAALFFLISINTTGGTYALFYYLARINFAIAVFNLIPGFPMDGGRVLRAALWSRTKNIFQATRSAAGFGRGVALFFIFFGLFSIFAGIPGGLWLMFIGWFLYMVAQSSYQRSTLQQTLSGVKIRDIMARDIVALSSSITIDEAVNGYFLRYGYGGFPVVDHGKFIGMITLKEIKNIRREEWERVKVSEVVVPHEKRWEVSPDDDAMQALELMLREDQGRLVIMEGERIAGLITRNGIARYVQIMGK